MPPLEIRLHNGVSDIDAGSWNTLVGSDHPFLAHAFLAGLEEHDCIRRDFGWQSCPIGLYRNDILVAAAPLYLKGNSHGEFVFDWSWASAYERAGLDYYPKLLCAVPYSPVTGSRLLVGNAPDSGHPLDWTANLPVAVAWDSVASYYLMEKAQYRKFIKDRLGETGNSDISPIF